MVKTLMLKVCEYNNPNVKFGFVSLDLVLSSRLQNYFGQRLCRINKCMGLESCELETLESRRDKPFTQINTNYATRSSIMSIIPGQKNIDNLPFLAELIIYL